MFRKSVVWEVPKWALSSTIRSKRALWWRGTFKNITSLVICNLSAGKLALDTAIDRAVCSRIRRSILIAAQNTKKVAVRDKRRLAEKFIMPTTLWQRKRKLLPNRRPMTKILIRKLTLFTSMRTTRRAWTARNNSLMMTTMLNWKNICTFSRMKWRCKLLKSACKLAASRPCLLKAFRTKVSGLPFSYSRPRVTKVWAKP